jgi:nucleoside-diphosphate-sugar epimerase
MHYIVTGGAGFIGSNTVYRLLQDGTGSRDRQPVAARSQSNLDWLRQAGET